MILDYKTIGYLYWNFCEKDLNVNFDEISDNLLQTVDFLIKAPANVIANGGRDYMLYALSLVFEKILKDGSLPKYKNLFSKIPKELMMYVISATNKLDNVKKMINKGITPKCLFEKPSSILITNTY